MERLIEESGGIFNAATSKDYTHFYIVIPKDYFYTAADILSDALTNPLFPEDEVEKERKVILEEIIRRQNQILPCCSQRGANKICLWFMCGIVPWNPIHRFDRNCPAMPSKKKHSPCQVKSSLQNL